MCRNIGGPTSTRPPFRKKRGKDGAPSDVKIREGLGEPPLVFYTQGDATIFLENHRFPDE